MGSSEISILTSLVFFIVIPIMLMITILIYENEEVDEKRKDKW